MSIDFTTLRLSLQNTNIIERAKNPEWLNAFAIYNKHHTRGEWLSITCQPCYQKVLAFLINNQITC